MQAVHRKEVAMSDFRFHLQKYKPGSKITCPECKRKRCFTRYVDEEGIIEFPDTVGRCDHEHSCGYHYTPKDFFHDNPDKAPKDWKDDNTHIYNKVAKSTIGKEKPKPMEPSLIPYEIVQKSIARFDMNPLHAYLCGIFGKEETKRLFQLYFVGTGHKWGGCTVFWQIDFNGNVRGGKLMGYNRETGHRIKKPTSQVTWAHSELKLQDFHLVQCLFGEYQLRQRPTAIVALVESEKTALVMAHFMPDFVWLATGGMDGCFNEKTMQVLRGRTVVLFPDLGGWDKWQKKTQVLKFICKRVIMSDVIEQQAADEHREAGLDIADFFLMKATSHEILADMIRRNSAVQSLVDKLALEICDEEESHYVGNLPNLRWKLIQRKKG